MPAMVTELILSSHLTYGKSEVLRLSDFSKLTDLVAMGHGLKPELL